jgi:hypothetical protein
MSNHAHRRRRPTRPTTGQSLIVALFGAYLAGCTCEPDVDRHHRAGAWHLRVAHDLDCPAVGRTQWAITRDDHHRGRS